MFSRKSHIDIQACIKGNRKAQRKFFDTYNQYLIAVASRYIDNYDDVSDVVQQSWIEVFNCLGNYKEGGNLQAWLKVITVRKAWKHNRKEGSRYTETINQINESNYSIEADIINRIDQHKILALVDRLPEGLQTIFKMAIVDELSHVEISEILGIAPSTSRAQLSKARAMIKKLFDQLLEKEICRN